MFSLPLRGTAYPRGARSRTAVLPISGRVRARVVVVDLGGLGPRLAVDFEPAEMKPMGTRAARALSGMLFGPGR